MDFDMDNSIRADRISGISIQKKSKREGMCNACSSSYAEKYEIVYEIFIGQSAFRVCPHCMEVLKGKLKYGTKGLF